MTNQGSRARPGIRRGGLQGGTVFAALMAVATGLSGAAEAGEWRVLIVNGIPAEGGPQFNFNADGTLSGSTGCNRFTANGRLTSGWLVTEGPVATTKKACPAPLSTQESQILSLFEDGLALTFDPYTETLKLTGRKTTIVLEPLAATPARAEAEEDAGPSATQVEPETAAPDTGAAEPPTLFNTAYVAVHGLSGRLNVRADASTSAKIVGGVRVGALLANKGCEHRADRTWCHVSHIGNGRPQGWAAAEYLKPAPAALRATQSLFDRIGTLTCTNAAGAAPDICDFGAARDPDGTTAVTIFLPDGSERLVVFLNGDLVAQGTTGLGDDPLPTATRVDDHVIVDVGASRFEIPESVVSGA